MKIKFLPLLLILALLLTGCYVEIVLPGTEPATQPTTLSPASETLLVHYLDVGQADCILVEYGDYHLLIDGGNREDGQMVVSYLEQQGVTELDAVVCTHAHEDHVGGLPSVLAVYPTAAVYAPTKTYSSNVFDKFIYYTDQQRLEITIPNPGDLLPAPEGLELTVLGPTKTYAETNDTSIVILASFGETSFLFTGDMEVQAENDMMDYWGDRVNGNVDVLKVGHHGSDTSSGYRFVYMTDPEYAIISVGEGNSYNHPNEPILARYQDAGIPVFRTDRLGTILATSDGKEITITWENQNAVPEDVAPGGTMVYIGNKNSKVFHAPDCKNLPGEKNRVEFPTYGEATDAGYTPCGACLG